MEKSKPLQTASGVSRIGSSAGNNKLKIRDNMDGVLETNGFYRKHVASEPDSIYRAVSDILYDTQFYRHHVKKAYISFENSEEGRQFLKLQDECSKEQAQIDKKYNTIRSISHIFKIPIEIVYTAGSSIRILKTKYCGKPKYVMHAAISNKPSHIESQESSQNTYESSSSSSSSSNCSPVKHQKENIAHLEGTIKKEISHDLNRGRSRYRRREPMLLCQSAPHQFDPVYKSDHIANAGVVQSILYEMLYKSVFNMNDAVEAADYMLNAEVDPVLGKPDVYDKEFTGTAMEALDNHLIPFPYKVAKALDPETYRNIEYDVWTCDKRGNSTSRSNSASSTSRNKQRKNSSPSAAKCNQTIGSLKRGTPCVVRSPPYHDIYGYVQGLTADNKNVEVYVPLFEYCIYVARKCILPVQMLPQEFSSLRKSPTAHAKSPGKPVHTRVFYSSSRGNMESTSHLNDEGYGSPTKSSDTSEREIMRRDISSIQSSYCPTKTEPYEYIAENSEVSRSRHHYGMSGCMVYPGCPICYTSVQQIPSNQMVPNAVNLSNHMNNIQPVTMINQVKNHSQYEKMFSDSDVRDIQDQNVLLARNRDPEWLRKVNFRVPPPDLKHFRKNAGMNWMNQSSAKPETRNMDENNNIDQLTKRNINDLEAIALGQNTAYPNRNPYSMPMQYEYARPRHNSNSISAGDCGNVHQEPEINSPSDVVIGYSTNLVVDIPHTPTYSIHERNSDKVSHSGNELIKPTNQQPHLLGNNSLPPIYVPVPYSVLGSMINSGSQGFQNPTQYGNEIKSSERMLPLLDNLHIEQQRICPSTPLATPSFPIPNIQSSGNTQAQIFQFPDTTQSTIASVPSETLMPWISRQTPTQVFEHAQEPLDYSNPGHNYPL